MSAASQARAKWRAGGKQCILKIEQSLERKENKRKMEQPEL
jgi:hypothetical protein